MVRSNLVSVSVGYPNLFNVKLTNTQNIDTPSSFQQMLQLPVSQLQSYTPILASDFHNVRFVYNGTGIPAWLESISNGVATIWVKLPVSIPANSSITIDMEVDASLNFDGKYWGEAPHLSPTYAEYDDGASVFGAYDNFAGTSLSSKWTEINSPLISVNNGIIVTGNSNSTGGIVLNTKYSFPAILEAYSGNIWGYAGFMFVNDINGSPYSYNGWWSTGSSSGQAYDGLVADPWGTISGNPGFQYAINGGIYTFGSSIASIVLNNIVSIYSSGSTVGQLINYGSTNSQSISASLPSTTYNIEIYAGPNNSISLHWIRYRAYPPNGVMPTVEVIA